MDFEKLICLSLPAVGLMLMLKTDLYSAIKSEPNWLRKPLICHIFCQDIKERRLAMLSMQWDDNFQFYVH